MKRGESNGAQAGECARAHNGLGTRVLRASEHTGQAAIRTGTWATPLPLACPVMGHSHPSRSNRLRQSYSLSVHSLPSSPPPCLPYTFRIHMASARRTVGPDPRRGCGCGGGEGGVTHLLSKYLFPLLRCPALVLLVPRTRFYPLSLLLGTSFFLHHSPELLFSIPLLETLDGLENC